MAPECLTKEVVNWGMWLRAVAHHHQGILCTYLGYSVKRTASYRAPTASRNQNKGLLGLNWNPQQGLFAFLLIINCCDVPDYVKIQWLYTVSPMKEKERCRTTSWPSRVLFHLWVFLCFFAECYHLLNRGGLDVTPIWVNHYSFNVRCSDIKLTGPV